MVDDRAGERDALPLASGELDRLAAAEAREAHHLERLVDPRPPVGPLTPLTLSPYSTFSATVMCGKSA